MPHDACERPELLPGAREALETLRAAGISVAVVTSGDRTRVAAELDHLVPDLGAAVEALLAGAGGEAPRRG